MDAVKQYLNISWFGALFSRRLLRNSMQSCTTMPPCAHPSSLCHSHLQDQGLTLPANLQKFNHCLDTDKTTHCMKSVEGHIRAPLPVHKGDA